VSEGTASQSSPGSPAASTDPGSTALDLHVNGEPLRVASPCTVAGLLETLELAGKRVAVALNHEVVIRSRHAEVELAMNDRIEILEAVGGG
jgi:sulfur carrier protein